MKKIFFTFLFFVLALNASAQGLSLNIFGNSNEETRVIDSLGYRQKHANTKSIIEELNSISMKLGGIGYIENTILENTKINDSVYSCQFTLKDKINFIHIYIGVPSDLNSVWSAKLKNDTIIIPYAQSESFLQQTLKEIESRGFSLAKLKLENIKKKKNYLLADLNLIYKKQRYIDDIVILGYDKFPRGYTSNLKRLYNKKTFNQANLAKIYEDVDKFRFVKQLKYPEILFEKDSTKIYVYVQKAKSNSFDGFIGFSNNSGDNIRFNGYLDLDLNNTLNSGERFSLQWKSDGNQQKTVNLALEIPYIFKSRFGIKTQLNIFKQDSIFQNTKTAIDIGYFLNYSTKIFLGYQATESSDIQNQNSNSIRDYTNSFLTSNFEFTDFKTDDFLFPEKTKINIKIGIGKRNSFENSRQSFYRIDIFHNLYLNQKNSFNLKSQNYFLQSGDYLTNELFRFGGIQSIRGFSENSLQANFFTSILTEYRYSISPSLYVHSIIDYGYFQDKKTLNNGNLAGIGFGFGLATKNGLLNLIYANGSNQELAFKNANSIVHVSFKTNF